MTTLEERVGAIEDRLAIYDVIATYGPAADSGAVEQTVDLWTDDGVYDIDGVGSFRGGEELASCFTSDLHQGYIHQGSAHVMSLPKVRVEGDHASAINYALLFIRDGEHFRVQRSVASRWDLVRTAAGWKVRHRTNVLLDGSEAGRSLLGDAVR